MVVFLSLGLYYWLVLGVTEKLIKQVTWKAEEKSNRNVLEEMKESIWEQWLTHFLQFNCGELHKMTES